MAKRITIKDIAKELNLHHSTVSRALRGSSMVNEATRKIVVSVARKHGYQINMSALHLRGNVRNTIALIVPNIKHSFFTNIISELSSLAHSAGIVISIFESNEKYEQEKEILNRVIQYNFAGVIASIAKNTMNGDHFRLLQKFNIPIVFFDRVCEDVQAPKVVTDNYESTFNAVELLISKGYRKIGHLTGPSHLNVYRDRHLGYLAALSKHKSGYSNHIINNKEFSIGEGKTGLKRLLEHDQKPDAIISSSSLLSIGILLKARELGIRLPDDLALISFGDNPITEIIEPRISSIVQPESEIARTCFEIMTRLIENNQEESDEKFKIIESVKVIKTIFVEGNTI